MRDQEAPAHRKVKPIMGSVGIEIAKEFVEIATASESFKAKRTREELRSCLSRLPKGSRLVMEATGRYHRLVAEVARELGLEFRCVNPFMFSLYRRSVNPRAKTDRIDARILQRFGEREWDRLREAQTPDVRLQRIKDLLELRETQVKLRTSWRMSMGEIQRLPKESLRAADSMDRSIARLDAEIQQLAGEDPLYSVFKEMDGVGEVLAPALVWLFRAHRFQTVDELVAFVGLDVRVRESGRYIGQRKLTKKGPAFLRRLLHCAANSQRRIAEFKPFFARYHQRGLRTNAVNVIAGRKLLRAALSLTTGDVRYDRKKYMPSP